MPHRIDWDKMDNLVPTIVQHYETRKVLMLAFMSRESMVRTQNTGCLTFFSRKRQQLWTKGEESGAFLLVMEMFVDCDGDTILALVAPQGDPDKICHLGQANCFEGGELPRTERP